MSSVGESILMALTVTVNKLNSSNVRGVRRNEANKPQSRSRRSGLISIASALVAANTAPQPQQQLTDSSSSSQLLREYLKRTEENKAKNDKEVRLDNYYKRNYKDYFEFVEGGLTRKDEEQLSQAEKGIIDWLKTNK